MQLHHSLADGVVRHRTLAAVKEGEMGEKFDTSPDHEAGPNAWDYIDRQVSQEKSEYNAVGGTDTKACANCQWFIPPVACAVVQSWPDAILPTGLSSLWHEKERYEREPMEVVIVGEAEVGDEQKQTRRDRLDKMKGVNVLERVIDTFKKFIKPGTPAPVAAGLKPTPTTVVGVEPKVSGFKVLTDAKGELRWVAWATNKWRDRDNPPEIFELAAHKEYVRYLDATGNYPEAWLWHTPGTKWGQADWADEVHGFLILSGTIDSGMEDVVERLAKEADLGISHGFRCVYSDRDKGLIGWYRTVEVSPLPGEAAANPWTTLEVIQQEGKEMNPDKRKWLVDKLGEDKVAEIEGGTEDLSKALAAAGVDFKESPDGPEPIEKPSPSTEELAEAAIMALGESEPMKVLVTAVKDLQEGVKGLPDILARLAALEKDDDAKVAALIAPRTVAAGFRASADKDTEVGPASPEGKAGPGADKGWSLREFAEKVGTAEPQP